MPKFLRIKQPGLEVSEIDIRSIIGAEIQFHDDGYYLMITNPQNIWVIHSGTFDECHYKLNNLHELLDIQLVDL